MALPEAPGVCAAALAAWAPRFSAASTSSSAPRGSDFGRRIMSGLPQVLGPYPIAARGENAVGIHRVLDGLAQPAQRMIIERVSVGNQVLECSGCPVLGPAALGCQLHPALERGTDLGVSDLVAADREHDQADQRAV